MLYKFGLFLVRVFWCSLPGNDHDWFNGGEVCRDCRKPRPEAWVATRRSEARAISCLRNGVCPKCGERLQSGCFIGNDGVFVAHALRCRPCSYVWDRP